MSQIGWYSVVRRRSSISRRTASFFSGVVTTTCSRMSSKWTA